VQRVKLNTVTQVAEFQKTLDAAVAQLKCDPICINTCTLVALTVDAKAACLNTCMCYATPAVVVAPVAPVTPIVAPVTPVVAPVVTPVVAPATPVVAPVTPVEVAPVIAVPAPVVEPVITPVIESPVIVIAEPAVAADAAQVLFLGEEALVASASGTMTGSLFLSAFLIAVTLLGAAFLQSKQLLKKPFAQGGLFNKSKSSDSLTAESSMLGEYLLIKA